MRPDVTAHRLVRPEWRRFLTALKKHHGWPEQEEDPSDPLEALIEVILSQSTTDLLRDRAFQRLKERFPTWDSAWAAGPDAIEPAIRVAGLSRQKAGRIWEILSLLKENHGGLDLSFLHDLSVESASLFLRQFRGVGPKSVACVLLFACKKQAFPIDTHVFRVGTRVGLIPAKMPVDRAHVLLSHLIPGPDMYPAHIMMVEHGRKFCRPQSPRCDACNLHRWCLRQNTLPNAECGMRNAES